MDFGMLDNVNRNTLGDQKMLKWKNSYLSYELF